MGNVSIAILESAQSTHSGIVVDSSTPSLQNTTKYNLAIFNGLHIFVFMGIGAIYMILNIVFMEHFKSS